MASNRRLLRNEQGSESASQRSSSGRSDLNREWQQEIDGVDIADFFGSHDDEDDVKNFTPQNQSRRVTVDPSDFRSTGTNRPSPGDDDNDIEIIANRYEEGSANVNGTSIGSGNVDSSEEAVSGNHGRGQAEELESNTTSLDHSVSSSPIANNQLAGSRVSEIAQQRGVDSVENPTSPIESFQNIGRDEKKEKNPRQNQITLTQCYRQFDSQPPSGNSGETIKMKLASSGDTICQVNNKRAIGRAGATCSNQKTPAKTITNGGNKRKSNVSSTKRGSKSTTKKKKGFDEGRSSSSKISAFFPQSHKKQSVANGEHDEYSNNQLRTNSESFLELHSETEEDDDIADAADEANDQELQMTQLSQEELTCQAQHLSQAYFNNDDENSEKEGEDGGKEDDDKDEFEQETLDLPDEDFQSLCYNFTQEWQPDLHDDDSVHDYDPGPFDRYGPRRYRKNEFWFDNNERHVEKIYKIQRVRRKGLARRAVCKTYVRMDKTYLGHEHDESQKKAWIEQVGELVEVKCRNLNQIVPKHWKLAPYLWEPTFDNGRFGFAYHLKVSSKSPPTKVAVQGAPTCLDLFAGIGGMSMGLEKAGFNVTAAVEMDDIASALLEVNSRNEGGTNLDVYCECVNEFLDKVEHPDLNPSYPQKGDFNHIHASTPCQGYSTANRAKGGGINGRKNNNLVFSFIRAVSLFKPDTASFENVQGILRDEHKRYLQKMLVDLLMDMNYSVRLCVLNSKDFGDPQDRRRVFLFASKTGVPLAAEPPATHGAGLIPYRTARDAIGDLEDIAPVKGFGRVLVYGKIVNNHSLDGTEVKGEQRKIDPDKPVTTLYGNATYSMVHYKHHRGNTSRELARFQSFPDTCRFSTKRGDARKQIQNAVPLKLATAVGRIIMQSCYVVESQS
ncbi:methyltransferase 1 [Seminavis robusta]|uniref:DNA (cytosine-5-)-methyltransferase n=1 Tax=Seminavis robusta TaxID=568900 RepID=A0A9N8HJJ5_9STRA|nr:methyltransferase 1 [Seminavis robusta]|eukprot:Sro695_g188710.1 methyltransferase 1 (898) ;mRNA; r:30598-33446